MLKKIGIIVFFVFLNFCNAQGYKIEFTSSAPKSDITIDKPYQVNYNLAMKLKEFNVNSDVTTVLKGNKDASIYIENYSKNATVSSTSEIIAIDGNSFFYKNHLTKKVVYDDHVKFKFFTIDDEIKSFDWILLAETKNIGGYLCQKAKCTFRGRDYFVFFTKEIPISDGPWKFNGLPGLILEAVSDDAVASISITFSSIVFLDQLKLINKFEGKKTISYDAFKSIYNQKYQQSLTDVVNDKGETRPMPKGFREIFID